MAINIVLVEPAGKKISTRNRFIKDYVFSHAIINSRG